MATRVWFLNQIHQTHPNLPGHIRRIAPGVDVDLRVRVQGLTYRGQPFRSTSGVADVPVVRSGFVITKVATIESAASSGPRVRLRVEKAGQPVTIGGLVSDAATIVNPPLFDEHLLPKS